MTRKARRHMVRSFDGSWHAKCHVDEAGARHTDGRAAFHTSRVAESPRREVFHEPPHERVARLALGAHAVRRDIELRRSARSDDPDQVHRSLAGSRGDAHGRPHYYEIGVWQIQQQLHSQLPPTTLYGYGTSQATASYPGATIVA